MGDLVASWFLTSGEAYYRLSPSTGQRTGRQGRTLLAFRCPFEPTGGILASEGPRQLGPSFHALAERCYRSVVPVYCHGGTGTLNSCSEEGGLGNWAPSF